MHAFNRLFRIVSALTLALFVTGCATTPTGAPGARGQLANKVWLLAGYRTGSAFIPLQPGEGTTARIIFKKNGSLTGTTGINEFSGSWKRQPSRGGQSDTVAITVRLTTQVTAPNEIAAAFEKDILARIRATRYLKMEKDSIWLKDSRNEILLHFIFRTGISPF